MKPSSLPTVVPSCGPDLWLALGNYHLLVASNQTLYRTFQQQCYLCVMAYFCPV